MRERMLNSMLAHTLQSGFHGENGFRKMWWYSPQGSKAYAIGLGCLGGGRDLLHLHPPPPLVMAALHRQLGFPWHFPKHLEFKGPMLFSVVHSTHHVAPLVEQKWVPVAMPRPDPHLCLQVAQDRTWTAVALVLSEVPGELVRSMTGFGVGSCRF